MTKTDELYPDPKKRKLDPRPKGLTEAQYLELCLKEGHAMLAAEEKASKPASKPSVTPAQKLDDTLARNSTNPYVRARIKLMDQMLPSYRSVIEKMDRNELPRDKRYDKFVNEIIELGDKYSDAVIHSVTK